MLTTGIWWDLGSGHTTKRASAYAAQLAAIGIGHVATMLTGSERDDDDGSIQWDWTPERLKRWMDALAEQYMTTTWTMYAWPVAPLIDEQLEQLDAFLAVDQPGSIELDLEGGWRRHHVHGFASLSAAAEYLMAELRARIPVIEVTSYPLHAEMGSSPSAAQYADVVVPQAYSYRPGRDDPAYGWLGRYGPGAMQRLALGRVEKQLKQTAERDAERTPQRIVCGLAAWAQTWRDHPAPEGMQVALDAALDRGITEIRYWSAKHALGPKANEYAADFIKIASA